MRLTAKETLVYCVGTSPPTNLWRIENRGNSLETPNVWVLSSFHPNVWKQPPPPQCLTRSGGCTPTLLSCRAGSDVDATAAADRTRKPRRFNVITGQNKKRRGERIAEGSGGERERRRELLTCLPLLRHRLLLRLLLPSTLHCCFLIQRRFHPLSRVLLN